MSLRNLLGSPAASALLGNPVVDAVALGAGAMLVVGGGAAWGGHKLYQHFKKKHLEKYIKRINEINAIYIKNVGNFSSKALNNCSFPPLFKFDKKADDSKDKTEIPPQCILLDKAAFDAAGKITAERRLNKGEIEVDPLLLLFLEEMKNAIKLTKLYCDDLNIKDDDESENEDHITRCILHHDLSIMDTFMSFKGFDWDIDSVHNYAEWKREYYESFKSNNSQHQTHLKKVYIALQNAEKWLRAHQDSLSIEDMLEQLLKTTLEAEQYLMETFTKFLVKNEDESLVNYATTANLVNGILREEATMARATITKLTKDKAYRYKDEVRLHESLLSDWIKKLSSTHLNVIDHRVRLKKEEMIFPENIFSVASIKANLKSNAKQIKEIQHHFNDCSNFMTRVIDPKNDKKLIAISDVNKLIDRAEKFALQASTIYKVEDLIKLLASLINWGKLLGEIRFVAPELFNNYRQVLNGLIMNVTKSIKEIISSIEQVHQENNENVPNPGNSTLVPSIIAADLNRMCNSWAELILLMDKREASLLEKMQGSTKQGTKEVKHDLFEMLSMYVTKYRLPINKVSTSEHSNKAEAIPSKDSWAVHVNLLDSTLKNIQARIQAINKTENSASEADQKKYIALQDELLAMQTVVVSLNQTSDKESALDTMGFVLSLSRETLEYLNFNKVNRQKKGADFLYTIKGISPDSHGEEPHLANMSNTVTSISMFKLNPAVEKKFNEVVETCKLIVGKK